MTKQIIVRFLEWRTGVYIKRTRPIVVAITGSIGKTSTTQAIATVLREKYSVVTTKYNYNTDVGVIATVFDEVTQTSPLRWLMFCTRVFIKSCTKPKTEVFVLELGTDSPGQIAPFSYLRPKVAVVTAVTAEHMEFFETMDNVAREELLVSEFAEHTIINADLVDEAYIARYVKSDLVLYGHGQHYDFERSKDSLTAHRVKLGQAKANCPEVHLIGRSGDAVLAAAAAVADMLSLNHEEITRGLSTVRPVPGRMSILKGVIGSTIVDDTYNSSPEAVFSALDYVYEQTAPQKIVLLGMMNELGGDSEAAHRSVGAYCQGHRLDLVVTLGAAANKWTAEEAAKNNCLVITTDSPVEAAEVIKQNIEPGAIILCKGSQNGVYAEETVKRLLSDPNDVMHLTRQHDYWPAKKAKQFPELLTS